MTASLWLSARSAGRPLSKCVLAWCSAALVSGAASFAQDLPAPDLHSASVPAAPEGVTVLSGGGSIGSLSDLLASDDQYLDVLASLGTSEVVVWSTAASEDPLALGVRVEVRIDGTTADATQLVAFRDFTTMQFVPGRMRRLAPGPDVVTTVVPPGDAARFVQPGTRRVEVRVGASWAAASGQPVLSLDRVGFWTRVAAGIERVDLRGYDAPTLNSSASWIRTVFDLASDRMLGSAEGVQLAIDVTDPGPFDYTFRAELRETNNLTFPANGTSQVYRVRFDVEELPDLYGPMTIFQRFSRTVNGPDIEVELTGANQFSNAVPNDLQVVAFGQRLRLGRFLRPKNELAVAIYDDVEGGYRVSLNGEVLHEASGIDTRASTMGSWVQFGLYPHGLHDAQNRADQIASGATRAAFTYVSFEKVNVLGEVRLDDVTTADPN